MKKEKKSERKPLSFSTTIRNPNRIAGFLNCILPFEGKTLTNEIIYLVIARLLKNKLYYPQQYEMKNQLYKEIFNDKSRTFSNAQIKDIIENSPQEHKEAGFDKGWPSRFDTWYKLPMEFGFLSYSMGEPILISQTGHMLIDAYNEIPVNEKKIQNVMLNSMIKYQSSNPFRKNANSNVPFLLLLNLLKMLKESLHEKSQGLFRQEIPLLICWPDNNVELLYNTIMKIRKEVSFTYSDEYMYKICLSILGATDEDHKRFKMNQICGEAVDEYIRKMRSTGLISLRGNGRFLDLNSFEQERIKYILEKYSIYTPFADKQTYYTYMGSVDKKILDVAETGEKNKSSIRKKTLYKYAKEYTKIQVINELRKVCSKKESQDPVLKFINAPTRLEFLTSIALAQSFKNVDVHPNYSVDDEGLPTFTASGGVADIFCIAPDCDSLFEVTLMCARNDQIYSEIIPISRHLKEWINKGQLKTTFSVFLAPFVHEDAKTAALILKNLEQVNIKTYDIEEFIERLNPEKGLMQFL